MSKTTFKYLTVLVLAGIALLSITTLLDNSPAGARSFTGYYQRGTVTIRAYKTVDYQDYLFTANHEWAHYVYDYKFTRQDLKDWKAAVDNCTVQTAYAKTYPSKTTRIYEEWAESYAIVKAGRSSEICQLKINMVNRYG